MKNKEEFNSREDITESCYLGIILGLVIMLIGNIYVANFFGSTIINIILLNKIGLMNFLISIILIFLIVIRVIKVKK